MNDRFSDAIFAILLLATFAYLAHHFAQPDLHGHFIHPHRR